VLRGGGWSLWYGNAWRCRSAYRGSFNPDSGLIFIGFRVVLAPGQP
jgi:formylglycine-generating enzyme required for sulfatase activity